MKISEIQSLTGKVIRDVTFGMPGLVHINFTDDTSIEVSDNLRWADDLDDLRRDAVPIMSCAHASNRAPVYRKRILCADGFSISVQASAFHYSEPRDNRFADIRLYELVEAGYPEGPDGSDHEVPQWFEDFRECGDSKVFPYVPIMKVMELIDAHGGRVEGGEIITNY